MVRRSAGFVSKRPHRKSRGGCTTCKRKKVKCDEGTPRCSYCSSRQLDCIYASEARNSSRCSSGSIDSSTAVIVAETNAPRAEKLLFGSTESPIWILPCVETSAGSLAHSELELLDLYKAHTWETLTVRDDEVVHSLNRNWLPHKAISHSYLLYAILSITAAHNNALRPNAQLAQLADDYRQKTLNAYNKALQNITNDSYETILITSLLLQVMVPPPAKSCTDAELMSWVSSFLSMTQGLRIIAGLKWACGLEKLDIFPIFQREVCKLPAPPDLLLPPEDYILPPAGPPGSTPSNPDPPGTYTSPPKTSSSPSRSPTPQTSGLDMKNLPFRPTPLPRVDPTHTPPEWQTQPSWSLPAPAFLPPPLMTLLRSLVNPSPSAPLDFHRATLVPVFHAFSPIFLSLYHYHLTSDFYVRVIVFPTFLPAEFILMVRDGEPRALVIMAWWFALVKLVPKVWWVFSMLPRILRAISDLVFRSCDANLVEAVERAYRIVRVAERDGLEMGAKSVFEGWKGVYWEAGGRGVGAYEESLGKAPEQSVVEVVADDSAVSDFVDLDEFLIGGLGVF